MNSFDRGKRAEAGIFVDEWSGNMDYKSLIKQGTLYTSYFSKISKG